MLKNEIQLLPTPAAVPATGRPRKLSREEIVAGAIALVEKHGPAALTMRALGKALHVQAGTLYNYFSSVDELKQEIGRVLLSAVPLPGSIAGRDARGQLIEHFMALRSVLMRHPTVVDSRPGSVSWNWSLKKLEAELALFSKAGINPENAIMVVRVLDVMCLASAQVAREWNSTEVISRRHKLLAGARPGEFPHVAATYELMVARLPDEQAFQVMLEKLIDSLAPQLRKRGKRS